MILNESVLLDALLDPIGELPLIFQVGMQFAGIDHMSGETADLAKVDGDERLALRVKGASQGRIDNT